MPGVCHKRQRKSLPVEERTTYGCEVPPTPKAPLNSKSVGRPGTGHIAWPTVGSVTQPWPAPKALILAERYLIRNREVRLDLTCLVYYPMDRGRRVWGGELRGNVWGSCFLVLFWAGV